MTAPYSLTAPAILVLQPNSAGTFKVTNSGSKPIVVSGSLGRYNTNSVRFPAATHATPTSFTSPWIAFSPAKFQLAPGQSHLVRISDHVPAGTQGHHFLNLLWTAAPVQTGATAAPMHLQGAVATSVEIPMPGQAVAITSHGLPQAPPGPTPGFPMSVVLLPLMLLLVVALVSALLLRRNRNRHLARHQS